MTATVTVALVGRARDDALTAKDLADLLGGLRQLVYRQAKVLAARHAPIDRQGLVARAAAIPVELGDGGRRVTVWLRGGSADVGGEGAAGRTLGSPVKTADEGVLPATLPGSPASESAVVTPSEGFQTVVTQRVREIMRAMTTGVEPDDLHPQVATAVRTLARVLARLAPSVEMRIDGSDSVTLDAAALDLAEWLGTPAAHHALIVGTLEMLDLRAATLRVTVPGARDVEATAVPSPGMLACLIGRLVVVEGPVWRDTTSHRDRMRSPSVRAAVGDTAESPTDRGGRRLELVDPWSGETWAGARLPYGDAGGVEPSYAERVSRERPRDELSRSEPPFDDPPFPVARIPRSPISDGW